MKTKERMTRLLSEKSKAPTLVFTLKKDLKNMAGPIRRVKTSLNLKCELEKIEMLADSKQEKKKDNIEKKESLVCMESG